MKRLTGLKNSIAILSGIALIFSNLAMPGFSFDVLADGEEETLADVTDLHWVEGSSATLAWDAVEDANYFAVTVNVYEIDGTTLIGTTETGTTSTEIDLQQEISQVVGEAYYQYVNVEASVCAQKKQNDEIIAQSRSEKTTYLAYKLWLVKKQKKKHLN